MVSRLATTTLLPTASTPSFIIGAENRSYKHQYSNIYFIRLQLLRAFVEERAAAKWNNIEGNPRAVKRVLEVTKGHLCYIIGTVYMEMPLKPNVMEDISRDRPIQIPPPPPKIYSASDVVTLEDESGRIALVGDKLKQARLITGVIAGILGMETPNGEFEVMDVVEAGFAPQLSTSVSVDEEMDVDDSEEKDPWIAIASGLDIGSEYSSEARIQMLVEYLTGESEITENDISPAQITRLILAGDSLSSSAIAARAEVIAQAEDRKSRKQAQDSAAFSPHPIHTLTGHLQDIGRTLPIHVLPGTLDPAGTILPQQPLPRAMFGEASKSPAFYCETNPTYLRLVPGEVEQLPPSNDEETLNLPEEILSKSRSIFINSGQPLNDMFKYLPNKDHSRLAILESTLKWRHMAPTAPDTLWCHPYLHEDPFMFKETPDIYVVGGQLRFGTKLVEGERDENGEKQKVRCRVVLVPHFSRTGVLVLVNLRTLDVRCVNFGFEGMQGGGEMDIKLEDLKAPAPSQMPVEPMLTGPEPSGSPGPM